MLKQFGHRALRVQVNKPIPVPSDPWFHAHSVTPVLLTIAVAVLGACASGPSLRVDEDVLEKISIENKLLLFDAENELNIAIDGRDQVVDEIEQIKFNISKAKRKLEVAERDAEVFASKGNEEKTRVSRLKAAQSEAHIAYLDARLDWARQRLEQQREKLDAARANFELAKARLVKKNNVPGAAEIEIEAFEEQAKDYNQSVKDSETEILEREKEMKVNENAWVTASKALQDATGGALGSRWVD